MDHSVIIRLIDLYEKNKFFVIVGVGFIGAAILGVYYYHAEMVKKEESAYEVLSHLVQDVEDAYQNPSSWQEVEKAIDIALTQFGSTRIYPYLIALKAQILIEKGLLKEAVVELEKTAKSMTRAISLDKLFLTKLALLRIATKDTTQMQKAVDDLSALSNDKKNIHAPYAQYMLAYYFERHGEIEKSKVLYEKLTQLHKEDDSLFMSPYVAMARDRLKHLGA